MRYRFIIVFASIFVSNFVIVNGSNVFSLTTIFVFVFVNEINTGGGYNTEQSPELPPALAHESLEGAGFPSDRCYGSCDVRWRLKERARVLLSRAGRYGQAPRNSPFFRAAGKLRIKIQLLWYVNIQHIFIFIHEDEYMPE